MSVILSTVAIFMIVIFLLIAIPHRHRVGIVGLIDNPLQTGLAITSIENPQSAESTIRSHGIENLCISSIVAAK